MLLGAKGIAAMCHVVLMCYGTSCLTCSWVCQFTAEKIKVKVPPSNQLPVFRSKKLLVASLLGTRASLLASLLGARTLLVPSSPSSDLHLDAVGARLSVHSCVGRRPHSPRWHQLQGTWVAVDDVTSGASHK